MSALRGKPPRPTLQQRVTNAAETILKREAAVGPIDLLVQMRLIQPPHLDQWKRCVPAFRILEDHIQCGSDKLNKIFRHFRQWASESNLESVTAAYNAASRGGERKLQILADEDPVKETFLLTRYQRADLTPARKKQIEKKLTKAADLVVFILTSDDCRCSECEDAIGQGGWMYREDDQPLCMSCADFDYLEFLPSGNATLTRRAKKFSALSAVVVRFNKRRKRFERQGLLVTTTAIEQAEESMEADADQRERQRARAAVQRDKQDDALVSAMVQEIASQFPGCPAESAQRIAIHTAERGSGRVGRSAAGREVDPQAIKLAVIAHIRHEHTGYDEMLMQGVARRDARSQIQSTVAEKLTEWQSGA
ncbi:MAG: DUF2293 domain-containing protein [Pirellulaceae bacterium]